MSTTEVILLVAGLIVVDGLVVLGIRMWVRGSFEELAREFPRRPARPSAVSKRFQSLGIGSTNFGGCIEIARDDEYVHFRPMWLARVFGALDFSVPRTALADSASSFGGMRKAKLGRWTIAVSSCALDAAPGRSR